MTPVWVTTWEGRRWWWYLDRFCSRGPFVRFMGFGGGKESVDFYFLAPESVVIEIRTLGEK